MNDTMPSTRPTRRLMSPAALLGAGVLVASLGATGAWLLHTPGAAHDDTRTLALAPNETLVAPVPAKSEPVPSPSPAAEPAPARTAVPPTHSTHPSHPVHTAHASPREATLPRGAGGSGTNVAGDAAAQPQPQPVAVCTRCGVVESVRAVQRKGQGSGLGAVAGGVLGGVLGNQVGKGNGRAAMTVLGAIGGGFAGNEVEKRVKSETVYEVHVRMDDGSLRTLTERTAPATGARVTVEGNTLRLASGAGAGA